MNFTRQCALRHIYTVNTLYLSSLWSDLSCAAELVIADSKLVIIIIAGGWCV